MKAPDGRLLLGCTALTAALMLAPARAFPPPEVPTAAATASPAPHLPPGSFLPAGSQIDFVLDEKVSSKKSQVGNVVRMHLAHDLVVGGVTLASAGTPATLKIVDVRHATAPDIDGSVRVTFDPLSLPGRGTLPVSVSHEYLTIDHSAGQESTSGITDSTIQVFLPIYAVAMALRPGSDLTLPPGTVLRARTGASIDASRAPDVVISTPPPFALSTDTPHSAFTPIPFYTAPAPRAKPKPDPTPSPAPPTPSAAPSPSAT